MSDQSSNRPVFLGLFSWLFTPLGFRLLTYGRFTVQLLPLWAIIDLWQGHSTGKDLLFNGAIFTALITILPWDLLGVWLLYFYLALLFLVVGKLGGLAYVGALAAVLLSVYCTVRPYPAPLLSLCNSP
jgi:hypothetical protein